MIAHLLLPGPHLAGWDLDPVVIGGLGGAAYLYARGLRILRGRGHDALRRQAMFFGAGLASLVAALLSPIDSLASDLLWVHMVQHLILIVLAAPLLVLGAPAIPLLLGLPLRWRLRLRRLTRPAWVRAGAGLLSAPGMILAIHVMVVWAWHAPGPYQAAVRHPPLHALEHVGFLGTALLFWWVLLPQRGRGRLPQGADVLYVFLAGMQGGALGALFTFASAPLYPLYATGAIAHGLTPLQDQQLAGLIMWIPTGVVYLAVAAVLFVRWLRSVERRLTPMTEAVGEG
jgi:putative membrane protein